MKRVLLCAGVIILAISGPMFYRARTEDKAVLQGKWQTIEATSNGEPAPKEMLKKLTLVFVGDTVAIMGAPPTHFRLDTTVTPAHIDFLNSANQVGIYKLDGNTLKICTGQKGDRPTSFVTKKYTDHTYMLLKRASK